MTDHGVSMERCQVCGGVCHAFIQTRDYNRRLSDEMFSYIRCGECESVFLINVPEDLNSFYPPDYYAVPRSLQELATGARFEQYKVDMINQYSTGRKLVEVGPATGGFALVAKMAGYQVHTIEMDEECCRFLREEVGVSAVHTADAVNALDSTGPYDVVAFWHVLEHMRDPFAALAAAARALAPGGIIVFAVPNPDALQLRLFRHLWVHLDAPRHLQLFPRSVFDKWAPDFDLEAVTFTFTDSGSLAWNIFGWERSLKNLLGGRVVPERFLRLGARLIAGAVSPLERSDSFGSTYTAVFRKNE